MPAPSPEPTVNWGPPLGPPPSPEPRRPRLPRLHLVLFLLTVATTIIAGALLATGRGFPENLYALLEHPEFLLSGGLPFSFTLIAILLSHEMGHYLASRHHHLEVSLPYFIPAPPPFIVGTFGAFIRIRSPIRDKQALLDVGCAGPLVGVAVAVPVLIVGLKLSTIEFTPGGSEGLVLGEPLLFKLLSWLTLGSLPDHYTIFMHPVAFAGWIGLLVTALNLIPVGQMDGGHVAYALFPEQHRRISIICLVGLVFFGIFAWAGWLGWAVLLYLLGMRHPPPYYSWVPLDRRRKFLGALTILVFLLSFTPNPITPGGEKAEIEERITASVTERAQPPLSFSQRALCARQNPAAADHPIALNFEP